MRATVQSPGSCGELVQGTLDGSNFLVTCPVTVYSRVSVSLAGAGDRNGQRVLEKTREAVVRTLRYLNVSQPQISIEVDTELPMGKGMASSSADISAACLATALACGRQLSEDAICDIALSIEPTDGIFLPGVTMIDHVSGTIRRPLGLPPAIRIAVFDVGGEVDTVAFNRRTDLVELNRAKQAKVEEALRLVEVGIQNGDCRMIGAGATLSSLANQSILFKPALEAIIAISRHYQSVGVNVAHSGTVMGVLFAPDERPARMESCIQAILQAFPDITHLRTTCLTGGGLTVLEATGHEQ